MQVKWIGQSGQEYVFQTAPIFVMRHRSVGNPQMPSAPGVYIFAKLDPRSHAYIAVYIGESSDLRRRLNTDWENHHCRDCIFGEGAASLHYLQQTPRTGPISIIIADQVRREIEADLRRGHAPPCNSQ